jgi:hypothetical protein
MSQFNPANKHPSETTERFALNICLQIDKDSALTPADAYEMYLNSQAFRINPIGIEKFQRIFREVRASLKIRAAFQRTGAKYYGS